MNPGGVKSVPEMVSDERRDASVRRIGRREGCARMLEVFAFSGGSAAWISEQVQFFMFHDVTTGVPVSDGL